MNSMFTELDLKEIRNNISLTEKGMFDVSSIYISFLNPTSFENLKSEIIEFHSLTEGLQDLIIKNFKKVFSGSIDQKTFAPHFIEERKDEKDKDGIDSLYKLITDLVGFDEDDLLYTGDAISKKILASKGYKKNIVVTLAECRIGIQGQYKNFKILNVSKTKPTKSEFVFNGADKKFSLKPFLDSIIQMTSPLDAIAYPLRYKEVEDLNRFYYYTSKSNNVNLSFIEKVAEAKVKLTKKQEVAAFNKIVSKAAGETLDIQQTYNFYYNLNAFEEAKETQDGLDEEEFISKFEIKKAFEKSNIEIKNDLTELFVDILGLEDYEFNKNNVLPKIHKKSIHIQDDNTEVYLKPKALEDIKQIKNEDGQVCLVIPIQNQACLNDINIIK